MLKYEVAGIHIHLLVTMGHAYCNERDRLEESYMRADEFVTDIEASLSSHDELLLLSDHGMTVDFYSDEKEYPGGLGSHSWRAYAASTTDTVPNSILDVKSWVDEHAPRVSESKEQLDIDEEQLRDLGYI